MSSILRRPMFRMGGSANSKGTGITSGLERKGYAEAGSVDMGELGRQFEELQKIKEQYGIKPPEAPPTGMALSDWLDIAGTGLELAFKPGVRTGEAVAEVVPGLLQRTGQRLEARKEKARGVEETAAAMKAEDIESIYNQLGEEAQIAQKVKQGGDYEIGFKLAQLKMDYDKDLEKFKDNPEKLNQIKQKYQDDRNKLITGTKSENIVAKAILGDTEFVSKLKRDIKEELKRTKAQELTEDEFEDYILKDLDREAERAWLTKLAEYALMDPRDFLEGFAKGGRVGLQVGGMPNQQPQPVSSAATNETGLSYDEVRARLPKEIGNDIVQLIVSSPMALQDFAAIQTQLDVDNFNSKYNVNLVLPQQEG